MGFCCVQTPYSCTRFRWDRFLRAQDRREEQWCSCLCVCVCVCVCVWCLHHDLGFLDEIIFTHGSFPDGFNGHFMLRSPFSQPHHSKLTAAQLLHEGQLRRVDLPFICTHTHHCIIMLPNTSQTPFHETSRFNKLASSHLHVWSFEQISSQTQ